MVEAKNGSQEVCCICLDSLLKEGLGRQTLPCGHVLHEQCITEMRRLGATGRCPLCGESHADLAPMQSMLENADLAYLQGAYDEEVRLYSEVLLLDPEHPHANSALGDAYAKGRGVTKDISHAMEHYEVASVQGHVTALYNLGCLHRDRGETEKAMNMFDKARGHGDLEYGLAAHNLGAEWQRKGDTTKAMACFGEAHLKGNLDSTVALARLHRDRGDMQKMLDVCEALVEHGRFDLTPDAGAHYAMKGDFEKALRFLELGRSVRDVDAIYNLACLHERMGNIDQAELICEEAHQLGSVLAAVKLGYFCQKRGELDSAIQLYEEACHAGCSDAMFNLGIIYRCTGQLAKAMEYFEKAARKGDVAAQEQAAITEQLLGTFETTTDQDLGLAAGHDACGLVAGNVQAKSVSAPCSALHVGDRVQLHGLSSYTGQQLNGEIGTIVKYASDTGRFGVKVDGHKSHKAIKSDNLVRIDTALLGSAASSLASQGITTDSAHEPFFAGEMRPLDEEDLGLQAAIETSVQCAGHQSAGSPACINGQVSAALLESRCDSETLHVVLLKFSRRCSALSKALLKDPKLAEYRVSLERSGFPAELQAGAKIFVRPEFFEPVKMTIELGRYKLFSEHVIVEPDVESTVLAVVQGMRKCNKVYYRSSQVLPLSFATASTNANLEVEVQRTFIHIKVPTSLCSEQSSGPLTM